jgi:hypothetical protein
VGSTHGGPSSGVKLKFNFFFSKTIVKEAGGDTGDRNQIFITNGIVCVCVFIYRLNPFALTRQHMYRYARISMKKKKESSTVTIYKQVDLGVEMTGITNQNLQTVRFET